MKLFPRSKFTLAFVIFIIYAYYINYQDNKHSSTSSTTTYDKIDTSSENKSDNSIKNIVLDKISENSTGKAIIGALAQKSFEEKYGKKNLQIVAATETEAFTVIDIFRGTGNVLNCGAEAVINYDAFLSTGIPFDSTTHGNKQIPISAKLGKGQIIKGLEAGMVGMKEGGKRKITIASNLAFDDPNFKNSLVKTGETVFYEVELVSIKPGPYKIQDNISTISETTGKGLGALCGDNVTIEYTDAAGNTDTKSFIIGNKEAPIGLELATIFMAKGGSKTVTIPTNLLEPSKTGSSTITITRRK